MNIPCLIMKKRCPSLQITDMCKLLLGEYSSIFLYIKKRRHSIINVCLLEQIHIERSLTVEHIISRIYELIKETKSLIEFEEQLQLLMHSTFAELVGDVFTNLNQVIKEQKQEE